MFRHRSRRLHRQQSGRSASCCRPQRRRLRQFFHRPAPLPRRRIEVAAIPLVEADLLNTDALRSAIAGSDMVFHLAANADVRFGTHHPFKDIEQNTIATYNVLEAMRANGIKRIAFSSTGSVYGEATVFPTPENAPFPVQTSLYGNSKVAAEGLISSYCEGFGFQGFIFRFVSILGERYTHGHVFDFYQKLLADPSQLEVLGNGKQRKSYLYIQDCIDAIMIAIERATDRVNIFNLGQDEYCEVNQSIGWICERLQLKPRTGLYRRRARLDRRQSVHLSRLQPDPRAGLDAEAVDPGGRHQHAGISDGQSLGGRGAAMKVCVYGLWHLGTVTAACLASRGIATVGLAETAEAAAELNAGKAPLFEPGLDALLAQGLTAAARSASPMMLLQPSSSADLLWISFDTPVDDDDVADVGYVLDRVRLHLSTSEGRRGRSDFVAGAGRQHGAAGA